MSVRVERSGPVTTVVLSRPEVRNAVDRATADELARAFQEFDEDDAAMVAVLCGDGDVFCAGFDLKSVAVGGGGLDAMREGPMGPTRMLLNKPVIAAVEGHAVAGGLELALWCDLRVVAEDAVMGVFNRRWGVPLIDGGTVRLPRLVGEGRALDLVLTGRPVGAEEALAMGLANRVVARGEARRAAEALAQEIARFPPTTMRGDRMSLLQQAGLELHEALGNESQHGMESLASGEALEGARRFAAGRGRHGGFEDI